MSRAKFRILIAAFSVSVTGWQAVDIVRSPPDPVDWVIFLSALASGVVSWTFLLVGRLDRMGRRDGGLHPEEHLDVVVFDRSSPRIRRPEPE